MVGADLEYVCKLISCSVITGPVLELGTGYSGTTCRSAAEDAGLKYFGTDIMQGSNVEYIANFEQAEDMQVFNEVGPFGTILILNVLEHTFAPLAVLDNARSLLRAGGVLVVLTPAVWPLHNFPMDTCRLLPNFYEEYAKRRSLRLLREHFEYVGVGAVSEFRNPDGTYSFPPPIRKGLRFWFSRAVHKILNTYGRAMFHASHVAVAAVFANDEPNALSSRQSTSDGSSQT